MCFPSFFLFFYHSSLQKCCWQEKPSMLMKLWIVSDCKFPSSPNLPHHFVHVNCLRPVFSLLYPLYFQSVNTVVPGSKVLSTAMSLAQQITANSPDAVQSSKVALLLSQKHNFQETFTTHNMSPESRRVYKGANIKVLVFFLPALKYLHSPC